MHSQRFASDRPAPATAFIPLSQLQSRAKSARLRQNSEINQLNILRLQ